MPMVFSSALIFADLNFFFLYIFQASMFMMLSLNTGL